MKKKKKNKNYKETPERKRKNLERNRRILNGFLREARDFMKMKKTREMKKELVKTEIKSR